MSTLLLSEVPEELLQRLRKKAQLEHTSIQEQVIAILNQSLQSSPNFLEALDKYYEKYPRSYEQEQDDPFADVRSKDVGRDVEL